MNSLPSGVREMTPYLDSLEDVRRGLVELVEAVREGADIERCQEMRLLYMALAALMQDRRDSVAKAELVRLSKMRQDERLRALGRLPEESLGGH